jgi:hypothetical protein
MSAFGPKRTSLVAPHMSALGSKADIGLGYLAGMIFAADTKPTRCLKLLVRWLASKDVAKCLPDEKNYNSG